MMRVRVFIKETIKSFETPVALIVPFS